jgi:hypothetical protein
MAQVGVDHADDFGVAGLEALDDRGAEPELAGAVNDLDRIARREIVGDAARSVRRIVVDDDQVALDAARLIGVENGFHEIGQAVALVVGRRDERQRGGGGDTRGQNP